MKYIMVMVFFSLSLVFANDFVGSFVGQDLKLVLEPGLSGTLTFQGQSYPVQAQVSGSGLQGSFTANGQNFVFEAVLNGDILSFYTGGATYTLQKQAANPLNTPSNVPTQERGTVLLSVAQQYQEGTRLASPMTGISFLVPQGFSAVYDSEVEGVVMQNHDQSIIMAVFGVSEASLEEMAEFVVGKLEKLELPLQLRGQVSQTQNSLSAFLTTQLSVGPGLVYVAEQLGGAGNVLAGVSLGLSQDEAKLKQLVDELISSARLEVPEVKTLAQEVAGVKLKFKEFSSTHSGATYSSDTSATLSGAGDESYDFCSDGSYVWNYKREVFMTNDFGHMESNTTDSHQGSWSLVSDLLGKVVLLLEVSDGREFRYELLEGQGGTVVLTDRVFEVLQSEQCH